MHRYEDAMLGFWFFDKHGILPDAGGWLDQSPLWLHDIRKALALLGEAMAYEMDDGKDDGYLVEEQNAEDM
jgi:hypothetical protein